MIKSVAPTELRFMDKLILQTFRSYGAYPTLYDLIIQMLRSYGGYLNVKYKSSVGAKRL